MVRVDSRFWSKATIATLGRLGVGYTMAVRTGNAAIRRAIATIDEDAWVEIDTPRTIRRYRTEIEATIEWGLTNGIAESNNAWIGRIRTNAPGSTTPKRSSR